MRPSSYLVWLAGTVGVLALAALSLTVVVDPYYMFGTPPIVGLTELKPRADQHVGIAKTYQLDRVRPLTLLLGNSRTEIGLDPDSSAWPANDLPVFNAAVAGGNVLMSLLLLREALSVQPPKMIVLGVDFLDFLVEIRDPPQPSEMERRLLVDRDGRPNPRRTEQMWKDRLATTLTIDALADSVLTLVDQNPATGATMTPHGFNPLHEYRVLAARSGYHGLFTQKMAVYRKQYALYRKPDFSDPTRIAAYADLTVILQLAAERHIPVVLYIHPYHAEYLQMLSDVGLWPGFEAWKHVLVGATERTPENDVRLFDFSGFNEFSTETPPPAGDRRTEMRWYWEPGHYKSALGEHILAAIFGGGHFGRLLTAADIDSALASIDEGFAAFRRQGSGEH